MYCIYVLVVNTLTAAHTQHIYIVHTQFGNNYELNDDLFAFISHERKQVVNQYLYLHFPTQFM